MQISRSVLVLFVAAAVAICSAYAEDKPNFTGVWKLDIEKSNFGENPQQKPQSGTDIIEHKDPNLKISVTQVGEMGEFSITVQYTTDGKESVNEIMNNPVKTIAKWDGNTLVLDSKGEFNGNEFKMSDKMSLSSGGKVMTIDRRLDFGERAMEQKMIFEKAAK